MQFQDIGEFRIVLTSQISKGRNSVISNCYRQDNQGLYPLCAKISLIQGEHVSHLERKIQELEEIRKMGNPNLQQIEKISYRMIGGALQLIVIMEKYETNLKNEMNRRFNKSEQLKLVEDLQSGLQALYQKKISHGDIRPENIYIKKDQNNIVYKLAYCQTSRILQSITSENQLFSIYIAPELFPVNDVARRQFMNDSKYCSVGYSDIFSLGVILSQLIFQIPNIKEKYEQDEIRQFHDSLLNNQINFRIQFISLKTHNLIIEMLKYLPSNRITFEKMCFAIDEIKRAECSQTQKTQPQLNPIQFRMMGTCLPQGNNIFGQIQQNPLPFQQGLILFNNNFHQNQQNNQFKPIPQDFKPEFQQQQQINFQNQQNNTFQPNPLNVNQDQITQNQQNKNFLPDAQNGYPQFNQQEQFDNRKFQQNKFPQHAQKDCFQVNQQQQFLNQNFKNQNKQNINFWQNQQNENAVINQQEQFQSQNLQKEQANIFQANITNFNPQFNQQQYIQNPNFKSPNNPLQQANIPPNIQQQPAQKPLFQQFQNNLDNFPPMNQSQNNQFNNQSSSEQFNDSQTIEKQALYHQPIVKFLENILNQSFQMMDKITFNQLEGVLAYFKKDYVSPLTNNLEEQVKCLKECFAYQSSEETEDIYIEFQFSVIQLSNPREQFQAKTIQEKKEILDKLYSRKNN